MKGKKSKTAKKRVKIRLPLPKKPGHPQGTPKGKRGYDRKRKKKDIVQEQESG